MEYLDYYADTIVWSVIVSLVAAFGVGMLAWVAWMTRPGAQRSAQVSCPQGGSALVVYRAEEHSGCVSVDDCPLRRDGRVCGTACGATLARASARLRG